MTKTKKVLAWIAQGKPRTEMAKDLGLDPVVCHQMINYLRRSGYIQPLPTVYELTQKGRERQVYKPKTPPAVIARKVAQRRERRERVEKANPSVAMVAASIERNASSVLFNLGRSA